MYVPYAHGAAGVELVYEACGLSLKPDLLAVTYSVMLCVSEEPLTVMVLPERVGVPTLELIV
jgi:hypothetical protein